MEQNKRKLENRNKKIIILIISLTLIGVLFYKKFDQFFCGDLDKDLKEKILRAEREFGKSIKVEHTPCEFNYLKITLKNQPELYDTVTLNSLHQILYNKNSKQGWATLLIYDKENRYLFSHSANNNIYKQIGD